MKIPTEISKVTIGQAIRALMKSRGFDQYDLMRELDCRPRELSRWVAGDSMPGGDWMLKLLALCPDEETRANFFVDIDGNRSKIRSTPGSEEPIGEGKEARPRSMQSDGRIKPTDPKPGKKR